jgi:hypothetical protein
MGETSTTTLNAIINKANVKELDEIAQMDADELIFYHAIRIDLDLLVKKPKPRTIESILNHSLSSR